MLQNPTEPVQANISQRLAFLTSKNFKDRKEVLNLIRDAYSLRSSYVHHGVSKPNFDLLQKVQHVVWTALRNILMTLDKFNTQKNLLDYIEELILT